MPEKAFNSAASIIPPPKGMEIGGIEFPPNPSPHSAFSRGIWRNAAELAE